MEGLKFIGTVYSCRFNQLIRDALHVLLHHEDAESADHDRKDQGEISVLKACFHEHSVSRDDGNGPGNHHCHHDKAEDDVLPLELVLAEHVSAQAARVDHKHRDRYGDEDTVHEVTQEIKGFLKVQIVVDGRLLREQRLDDGLDLSVCLEGGEHHPHEREDSDDSQQSEHDV